MSALRTVPLTLTLTVAALVAGACVAVTINVAFPQEKIDSAADSIEDLVRGDKEPPSAPPKPGAPAPAPGAPAPGPPAPEPRSEAPGASAWLTWIGPVVAEAQTPRLKTRTPEVLATIQSRRARYPELSAAMVSGCIGENSQGLVEARPGTGCPPNVGALVSGENHDRMSLYQTIVQQNEMPPADIARVQAGFAKAHRKRAAAGTWVQEDDGRWTRR